MKDTLHRRDFLKTAAGFAAGVSLFPLACQPEGQVVPQGAPQPASAAEPLFKISLAQWSLHRAYFGGSPGERGWNVFFQTLHSDNYRSLLAGDIDPPDFPVRVSLAGYSTVKPSCAQQRNR